jgi:molybdenum cofactor biosynthesis protein B
MASNNKFEVIDSTKKFHLPKQEFIIYIAIIVISDSLTREKENWRDKDKSCALAESMLRKDRNIISIIEVIPDDISKIQSTINDLVANENINFILTIGGTGISFRDVTFEAVKPLLEKELIGFGELFRQKTFEEKGTISIMTRSLAGIIDRTIICCLPGSPNAVRLGISLIEPEIQHILNLRK